ncbi:TonB-dependent receptor domain-containing protein [Pontibacter chitinilyticus]|uniref:TonB-dependent receptor domain-containing protein n=1 Tax=Pontibacter chitinilyticus TaxID=2674989 RepID=UPI003219DDA5
MDRKTQVNTLILFLLIFLSGRLQAQELRGRVLQAQTHQPLQGVTVSAGGASYTLTDEQGYFLISLPDTAAPVIFSSVGFSTDTAYWRKAYRERPLQVLLRPRAAALQEVEVQGYETNRPLLQTAGAISVIKSEVLHRFSESSLVRAVNTVPGVRMDERAPASYRLSIRGSTLRSPYGIRNIKLYFNGIPLTEANGTTLLNLLDPANFGRIEILKGPTGSIYGAGTGGTVLLEPKRADQGQQLQVSASAGSYGYRHYIASYSSGSEKSNLLVQYTRQQYDGYREQSAVDRQVLLLSSEFYTSEKRTIAANVIYSNLYYELPGGLTQEQYTQNPRQARGGMFGSVVQNASIQQNGINIGLKQEYKFNDSWRNTTAIYGLHHFKDNPFNTDYERNTDQELGGRTSFVHTSHIGSMVATYTFGGEFQRGFETARTYDNNHGTPDSLRTDDEVTSKAGFLFVQTEVELPAGMIATAALSLNDAQYKITRLQQATSGNQYQYTRDFNTVLSPRIALLKRLTNQVSVHASVSSGFSPPTEEEILPSDGSFNTALEAEKGINYEAGIRGFALHGKLNFDVVGFYFRLKETIVSRQEVSSIAVFQNVGATSQTGLETSLSYTLLNDPTLPLSLLKVWGSYTYSHFRFKDYQKDNTDLSGNKLTGVAPNTATLALDMASKAGVYLNVTASYVDRIPLTDENTVFADRYVVVGARAGWRKQLVRQLALEVFGGVDNLTNETYSLGNDLNAFGGRYYQPAPARNYFGGLSLKYKL